MAKAGYETVGIDVYSAVQGESVYVDTSYGRVHVLVSALDRRSTRSVAVNGNGKRALDNHNSSVCLSLSLSLSDAPALSQVSGDTTKPACVTYHEVGVNSRTCFQGFFSASEPKKSLLLQSYCFYHFDYPGCEAEGGKEATAPSGAGAPVDGPTLEQASLQVGEAMKQLGIKGALGMGVGAGAYVLGKTSLAFPNLLSALVLLSPCCKKVTWWEYTYGKVLLNCLWYYGKPQTPQKKKKKTDFCSCCCIERAGWSSRFAHRHLYERLFSSKIVESEGYGVPDLLYTFNQEVERIDPRAIARYLQAVLAREDVVEEVGRAIPTPSLQV